MPPRSSVAAQRPVGSAVGSRSATDAASVATTVPRTSTSAGSNASSASRPTPITDSGGVAAAAASTARSVLGRRARPKSSAWLFAIVATSTPAAASASNAAGPAEKVNRLPGSGRPPVPTEVSRLTIVTSAVARASDAGASAVAGSRSRAARTPSKCTSPASAIRTGPGSGGSAAGEVVPVDGSAGEDGGGASGGSLSRGRARGQREDEEDRGRTGPAYAPAPVAAMAPSCHRGRFTLRK